MNTPDRTTAAAFPQYPNVQVLADSSSLQWSGIYVRRYRYPRVVDSFLVPATPEPLIACVIAGSARFHERDIGAGWLTRRLRRGDIFVTRSKTPYEVRFSSPVGEEIDVMSIHLTVDRYLAALQAAYSNKANEVEVIDFFGRDDALAYLCFACAEMLLQRVAGTSQRVALLIELFAGYIVEKYTNRTTEKRDFHGGLPICQLHKVEDHVREHLPEDLSVDGLAKLVELSPFHFSRVFKQTTGMSPLQFVTRERIARAQQLIRETSRSIIDVALEVGYTSPSHFTKVFRRVTGVAPNEFRTAF